MEDFLADFLWVDLSCITLGFEIGGKYMLGGLDLVST